MRRGSVGPIARVSVVLASAALGVWVALLPSVAHPADLAHPVLAYYYVWWDPSVFDRTLFPPLQPYNSDDLDVIQRHVNEAKSAGIDGFVVDWYGNGDRTDANFAHLLDIANKSGFSATVHFETPHFDDADDVTAQLRAFYQHYGNNRALVRYGGQPVIFFWQASDYDNGTWSSIRGQVDPNHSSVWLADGDNFNIMRGDAWDGISPYAIAWSADPASQLPRWANTARGVAPDKLWNPPVSPGCNDSAARAPTCIQDRAGG